MNSLSLFLIIKGSELLDVTKKLNARGNLGSVLDTIPQTVFFCIYILRCLCRKGMSNVYIVQ